MSHKKNYVESSAPTTQWHGLTRLNQDVCAQTLEQHQSQLPGLYQVGNPGYRWCEPQRDYVKYMSEPYHHYKQYFSACRVNNDSDLRYAPLTDQRYIHQLFTRPYKGAYMGAGQNTPCNKDTETQLIYGNATRVYSNKACDALAEVSIDRFECLPEYGNPQKAEHIIEPWVRGGEHTRDYIRRINYEKQCLNKKNNMAINGKSYAIPMKKYPKTYRTHLNNQNC